MIRSVQLVLYLYKTHVSIVFKTRNKLRFRDATINLRDSMFENVHDWKLQTSLGFLEKTYRNISRYVSKQLFEINKWNFFSMTATLLPLYLHNDLRKKSSDLEHSVQRLFKIWPCAIINNKLLYLIVISSS